MAKVIQIKRIIISIWSFQRGISQYSETREKVIIASWYTRVFTAFNPSVDIQADL
jgi:hypothetical protein